MIVLTLAVVEPLVRMAGIGSDPGSVFLWFLSAKWP